MCLWVADNWRGPVSYLARQPPAQRAVRRQCDEHMTRQHLSAGAALRSLLAIHGRPGARGDRTGGASPGRSMPGGGCQR